MNGNFFVICLSCYYLYFFLLLIIVKSKREEIQTKNIELDKLRKKSFKTLEEQKKFLQLKNPINKFTFSFNWLLCNFLHLLIYAVMYYTLYFLFKEFNINISFWQGLLCIFIVPIILNFILKKLKLEK